MYLTMAAGVAIIVPPKIAIKNGLFFTTSQVRVSWGKSHFLLRYTECMHFPRMLIKPILSNKNEFSLKISFNIFCSNVAPFVLFFDTTTLLSFCNLDCVLAIFYWYTKLNRNACGGRVVCLLFVLWRCIFVKMEIYESFLIIERIHALHQYFNKQTSPFDDRYSPFPPR